ncbi:MAG: 2-C-methyl-D-erythritol 4-phosphate cytidylyltransferase [Proteobacteria bacterium]|nr:2-C-methyl-D-erythritol 4-phosphate cytidylyltransferase [Pseudomonadota bacterium]
MTKDKWVIIPAAGNGSRFGENLPKQYYRLAGKTIIEHTLSLFTARDDIKGILVAISTQDTLFSTLPFAKHPLIKCVNGGKTRSESVLNAIHAISPEVNAKDWVLVHDAVRPCLNRRDLQNLINILSEDKVGGILAVPVTDTLKKADNKRILQTVPRTDLWQALTPQMFRCQLLYNALMLCKNKNITVTDEASAIEEAGFEAKLVNASFPNPKLTYYADKILIENLLSLDDELEQAYV